MIYSTSSTLPSFKEMTFSPTLNVLLADTLKDSKDSQTRNSAGKTSLIELFHFLLAASNSASPPFRDPRLIDHEFSIKYGTPLGVATVSRSGAHPNVTRVVSGSDAFATQPVANKGTGVFEYTREQYAQALGEVFFGLPFTKRKRQTYSPTFRSIISYLIRRDYDGGFLDAEKNAAKQVPWDAQVNLSFVLGLDWPISREFQLVRDKEKSLETIKAAARTGAFGTLIETVAALRAKVAKAGKKAAALRDRLSSFVVADAYNELATEAAQLGSQISKSVTQNLADETRLRQLQQLLIKEQPPSDDDLLKLFQELEREVSDQVRRRFDEVRSFHESVLNNRRHGLESEVAAVRSRITARDKELKVIDRRRSEILAYLSGKGALEDFVNLQKELSARESEAADLQRQFYAAQLLEGEKASLEIERQQLYRRLQADLNARGDILDDAIVTVDQLVSELYGDRTGELLIVATDNGPKIQMQIEGDRGGGISKMEIFCFDMALAKILQRRGIGPRLLVHDSHLFDGVDKRQVAKALEIGLRESRESGFQYIVTMNSDVWQSLKFTDQASMNDCILPVKLDDRQEEGSLFGVRLLEHRELQFGLNLPGAETDV